jgi:hypothetical protein
MDKVVEERDRGTKWQRDKGTEALNSVPVLECLWLSVLYISEPKTENRKLNDNSAANTF